MSVAAPSNRRTHGYTWFGPAFAFLLGAALAGGVLDATIIQPTQHLRSASTIGPGWTCNPGPRSSCTLANARTNVSTGAVSSWCLANNSYSDGNLTGTTWTCQPTPMDLEFDETVGVTLSGAFSVNGPFELFLVPEVQGCILVSSLEDAFDHVPWSCALPVGSSPYPWLNLTSQVSNPVDLSGLTYNFGHPSPDIPPGDWALWLVDIGTGADIVHFDLPLAVSPV
jgi:hypothetical protein